MLQCTPSTTIKNLKNQKWLNEGTEFWKYYKKCQLKYLQGLYLKSFISLPWSD
jgi:hypothetical protein